MNEVEQSAIVGATTSAVVFGQLHDIRSSIKAGGELPTEVAFDSGVKVTLGVIQDNFFLVPKMTTNEAGEPVERATPADIVTDSLSALWDGISN